MAFQISGTTRLFAIMGWPIGQVQSPRILTGIFHQRGVDAVLAPLRVSPEDFAAVLATTKRIGNLGGLIMTVPHKLAAVAHADDLSPRVQRLGACNVLRRGAGGRWAADMMDGVGFSTALRQRGFDPRGKRALIVGAGGVGSAMALALVEAGVAELAIHDTDGARATRLLGLLAGAGAAVLTRGSSDPHGFDLVANATPLGMGAADPLPVDVTRLQPATYVADVVTKPTTPLLEAARERGCRVQEGTAMTLAQADALADFLLAAVDPGDPPGY